MDITNRCFSILLSTIHIYKRRYAHTKAFAFLIILIGQQSDAALVAINEFHYDNTGSDTNEGIELIGVNGTDLNNWSIVLYNGTDQSPYKTINLSSIASINETAFSFWHIPISGIQNGSNDGIALVDDTNSVQDFISYEGGLTAVEGPAKALSSVEIIISENMSTPTNYSLQRIGSVTINGSNLEFSDDDWEAGESTWGLVNQNQLLNQAAVPLPAGLWLMLTGLSFIGAGKLKHKPNSTV